MKLKRMVASVDLNLYIAFYALLRTQGMTYKGWLQREMTKFIKKHGG